MSNGKKILIAVLSVLLVASAAYAGISYMDSAKKIAETTSMLSTKKSGMLVSEDTSVSESSTETTTSETVSVESTAENTVESISEATDETTEAPRILYESSVVYVVGSGKKYHTSDCRYTKNGNVSGITAVKAVSAGYTACAICNPGTLKVAVTTTTEKATETTVITTVTTTAATTKKETTTVSTTKEETTVTTTKATTEATVQSNTSFSSDTKVYVVGSGKKYHKGSCRYVKNGNSIELTISSAVSGGYTACKVCNPGTPENNNQSETTQAPTSAATDSSIVYITPTGKKYHKAGCRYVTSSASKICKSKAISQGYGACSVCF